MMHTFYCLGNLLPHHGELHIHFMIWGKLAGQVYHEAFAGLSQSIFLIYEALDEPVLS
jgi:hypothetical protein